MTALAGQVVLVTGAARGVGQGIARALGKAGAAVVLAVRDVAAGHEVRRGLMGDGRVVGCDVTNPAQIEAAVDATLARFGRLDHVVHNATSGRSNEVTDLATVSRDVWDDHVAVAWRALFRLARQSAPALQATAGSLVVLTSAAGIEGSDTLPLYATVKAGQRGFVKALAREWGPRGVRVNGLAPLAVSTALTQAFTETPDLEERLAATTPLGRIGDPEHDIGPAAVFLCSAGARYLTGQTLMVSGGRFTGL